MRRFTAIFLAALVAGAPQQPAPPKPQEGVTTFTTVTQLVVQSVIVKDKKGNPITSLTAKDFTILEDGKPQTIAFVEYQTLPEAPETGAEVYSAPAVVVPKLDRTRITPEKPGEIRHQDRRLMALYFDMSAMPVPDQFRALAAAQRFVRTQTTPADLMAIMMFAGGSVQVLLDFTDDRDKLLTALQTLIVGEDQTIEAVDTNAESGAGFGQNEGEFNLFNTDRQLAALQTAARMLGSLNERKSLLYFASGLRLNGVDNQAQLHATVNAAVRSGVSIWPIDARGLVATAPLGDASRGSPGGIAAYTGATAMSMSS
ncbi:MAG: VWA domain-containing protein, partial [Bryobacteraceae bacterium]